MCAWVAWPPQPAWPQPRRGAGSLGGCVPPALLWASGRAQHPRPWPRFRSRWQPAVPMGRSGEQAVPRPDSCLSVFRGNPQEGMPCRSVVSSRVSCHVWEMAL